MVLYYFQLFGEDIGTMEIVFIPVALSNMINACFCLGCKMFNLIRVVI